MYENAASTVRLAPAYDLVCTTVYEPADTMALTLNDSKAFPHRKELEAFARVHCDLPPTRAKKSLQRVTEGVARATREIGAYADRYGDFAKAADRLIARFNRGLQRLDLV